MKNKKKIICICLLILCAIVIIAVGIAGIILGKQIRTIQSIQKISEGFYQINYQSDYKLDEILNANIVTESQLAAWISKNLFYGYPLEANDSYYGCSVFSAKSPDGEYLMGRNFDYTKTDTLLIYTHPDNGYASYALCDLDILGVGEGSEISADSLEGKVSMLASVYTITEGLNEAGLGAAILELETDEIHQDNGNPDMLLFVALRAVLDRCASVDEAVAFMRDYDIHTFFESSFHLYLSDSSGKSVVVEWIGNNMNIIETDHVTNFQLSEGEDYLYGIGHDRYEILEQRLYETKGVMTESEAMELLSDVCVPWNGEWDTEWSCVFNLSDFTIDVAIDMDYENIQYISLNNFKD